MKQIGQKLTVLQHKEAKSWHKTPPIGHSSRPIGLKLTHSGDLMAIHIHMKYEKDRSKTEGVTA